MIGIFPICQAKLPYIIMKDYTIIQTFKTVKKKSKVKASLSLQGFIYLRS